MIKHCLAIACCLVGLHALAQNCQDFIYFQKNKTVEISIYNKKGEPNGKQVYQITDVTNSGATLTAALSSEMFDKNGKSTAKANSSIQCTGGEIMVDMHMMLPQQQQERYGNVQASVQGAFLNYPVNLKVGDALKDGSLIMDLNARPGGGPPGAPGAPGPPGMPGPPQTLTMVITDRKVEAKESVTTAAGTWDCFKISYKSKITVKTGPFGIPIKVEGSEWYAPNFGVVKTESKYGSTVVTAVK